jgi:hypothetical protein
MNKMLFIIGFLITDYDGVGMVAHTGKPASGVKMELR